MGDSFPGELGSLTNPTPSPVFARVVAGTDGSARAEEAVRQGARLASANGASLRVAFVVDSGHPHDSDVDREANEALGRAVEAARSGGAEAETRVLGGDPVESLVVEAEEHAADLLCVGPDAGFVARGMRLGRVAAHVLRHAPCSVLVGREAGPRFPSRVLCAVDGSESSTATARLAGGIAARSGAELRLLHVIPVFRGDSTEWIVGSDDEAPPELVPATEAVRELGIEPHRQMAMGRAEEALVAIGKRDDVDLVVVGSRGLSGLSRVLLGSVSEYVAQHAHCSVLVARRPSADARG